jgi:hypothetical protein
MTCLAMIDTHTRAFVRVWWWCVSVCVYACVCVFVSLSLSLCDCTGQLNSRDDAFFEVCELMESGAAACSGTVRKGDLIWKV